MSNHIDEQLEQLIDATRPLYRELESLEAERGKLLADSAVKIAAVKIRIMEALSGVADDRRRAQVIKVLVTHEELEQVQAAARLHGLPVSTWLRVQGLAAARERR